MVPLVSRKDSAVTGIACTPSRLHGEVSGCRTTEPGIDSSCVEITPAMIAAGEAALNDSALVEYVGADWYAFGLIAERVYRSMRRLEG